MHKTHLRILAILALVQFNHILDFVVLMPLGPTLMQEFHLTPDGFSYVVSAYTLAAGLMGFLGAFWLDRFDRKTALGTAFTGFIAGTLLMALSPSYEVLLGARLLTGLFGGLLGALVFTIIGDTFPLEKRAQAMGVVTAAFSAASVLGVPTGLWLANTFGWHWTFYGIVGTSALVYPLIWLWLPRMRDHLDAAAGAPRTRPLELLSGVAQSRAQLSALGLVGLLMVGQFGIITMMNPYLVNNVGFREADLPLVYLVGGLLTLVSSPTIGRIADKRGHRRVFQLVAFFSIAPLLIVTHLPAVGLVWGLVVMGALFVFVSGRLVVAFTLITSTAHPSRRAGLMSLVTMTQHLFVSLGALIGGWVVTQESPTAPLQHFSLVGYIAAGTTVVAVVLVGWVKPHSTSAATPIPTLPRAATPSATGVLPCDPDVDPGCQEQAVGKPEGSQLAI